jgi:hypothetical protein
MSLCIIPVVPDVKIYMTRSENPIGFEVFGGGVDGTLLSS